MSDVAEKLKSELTRLTAKERAEIARFLIQSLDNAIDADAEDAWDAELARRAKEIKAGKAIGEPADKVFKDLTEKYS